MTYLELLVALRNRFMNDSSMLDDDESSFALGPQKDPKKRFAWFLSKVENRIDNVSAQLKCGNDVAGILYFEKLCQMDQNKSEPSPRYLKLCPINQSKSRRRYLGAEKWRARRQQNIIPAKNVSDAEERIKPIDMNGGIISNLERKSKLNEDDCTEMTAAESLDLSLDTFSINGSVIWHKDRSVVVSDETLRQIRQII